MIKYIYRLNKIDDYSPVCGAIRKVVRMLAIK